MTTWIIDENGNRASVEKWGNEKAARESLKTLKDCSDCTGCSDCSDCSYCSDCSGCVDAIDKKVPHSGSTGQPTIPKIDNIHKKVYEAVSQPGALKMSDWHTCSTTHCRAGWVVHLAGDAGYALERFHNTALAAQLIYRESGYKINPCRFYDQNEDSLEDIRKLSLLSTNT